MSDISDAVARARAVAAKLTAAAAAQGKLSEPTKRRAEDDVPTSGYSSRNLYGDDSSAKRQRPEDAYKDVPVSGFVSKSKPGLGSDDATNSFLAKLGLSGGIVSTKISKDVSIPADMVGLIIGRGGETLKKIQADTGVAKIQISQDHDPADSQRRVTLIGSEQEIERANKVIMELVSGGDRRGGGAGSHYGPRGGNPPVQMEVPGDRVGLVIGRGGETIKMLQAKTGARITVIQDGAPRQGFKIVTIQGTDEQVEESKRMINDIVEARVMVGSNVTMGGGPQGQEMEEVRVPNDRVGLVIGKGGENVKAIQGQFGVRLQIEQIPEPTGERLIRVFGPNRMAIQAAIEIVHEKASGGRGGGGGARWEQQQQGYGAQQQDPYAAMMGGQGYQDYAQYYAQYYSDPSAYAAYAAAAAQGQQGGSDGAAATAGYGQQDAYQQAGVDGAYPAYGDASNGGAAAAAASAGGDGTTAAAGGDDAANAAAWAQYYAYYAQYGGDPSAAGAGAEQGGNGEEAPPGA